MISLLLLLTLHVGWDADFYALRHAFYQPKIDVEEWSTFKPKEKVIALHIISIDVPVCTSVEG